MTDLANWHSGDQSYMILPSDLTDNSTSSKAFDVKLLGIDGGGKQFDTKELITERQKAILNCFGAGFILLGQESVGSYALSETQQGLHSFFVEKDINFICEVFNKELIPQLLALNEIRLEDEDMPFLAPSEIDEEDKETNSKAIQRAFATGAIPLHPEVVNENLKKLGYEYRLPEDMQEDGWQEYSEKYMPNSTSRSGDGMESGLNSGVGGADGGSGNTSDTNSDNAS